MAISWHAIQPFEGSQHTGFEKLCAHLALYEKDYAGPDHLNIPEGAKFTTVGNPDAGVECYWTCPDGSEIGWQAKYFLSAPNKTQWHQIDKSVDRAFATHPSLREYVICIPQDLAGPGSVDKKGTKRKYAKDKWNESVATWQDKHGNDKNFVFWGSAELLTRLARPTIEGVCAFWFGPGHVDLQALRDQAEQVFNNVGPRYIPELTVDVPAAKAFDVLGHVRQFREELPNWARTIYEKARALVRHLGKTDSPEGEVGSNEWMASTLALGKQLVEVAALETVTANGVEGLATRLDVMRRQLASFQPYDLDDDADTATRKDSENRSYDKRRQVHEVCDALGPLETLLEGAYSQPAYAKLLTHRKLILIGQAGSGKTHLFCEVASKRLQAGLPTLLALGRSLDPTHLWEDLGKAYFGQAASPGMLLQALNAMGMAYGHRALILIDAVNESHDRHSWQGALRDLLRSVEPYPFVAVAVSVRTRYMDSVVPGDLRTDESITFVEHDGFSEVLEDAVLKFCSFYKVPLPGFPILMPELNNPLMLTLLFKTRGPANPWGAVHRTSITCLFDAWVQDVDDKLSVELNYDAKVTPLKPYLDALLHHLLASQELPYTEAHRLAEQHLPTGRKEHLLRRLISEGMLIEYDDLHNDKSYVAFGYERFENILMAEWLISRCGTDLRAVLPTLLPDWAKKDEGLIAALMTVVPESTGAELAEYFPQLAEHTSFPDLLSTSLVARKDDAVGKHGVGLVTDYLQTAHARPLMWDLLVSVAYRTAHPLNAYFLHQILSVIPMPERDAQWSAWLAMQLQATPGTFAFPSRAARTIEALLNWAASKVARRTDSETRTLCGIALGWLLTCPNRFIRDRATKSLTNLYAQRPREFRHLLQRFEKVDDPYVTERLLGAGYGVSVRPCEQDELGDLANYVYEHIFCVDEVCPHVLIRDYAQGICEAYVNQVGDEAAISPNVFRPPHRSSWPIDLPECPTVGDSHIHNMVYGQSDFARYIIGTNHWMFDWTPHPIHGPDKPKNKDAGELFLDSLGRQQREHYNALEDKYRWSGADPAYEEDPAYISFAGSLSEEEREQYNVVRRDESPVITSKTLRRSPDTFPLEDIQDYIYRRICQLGWSSDLHGPFDQSIGYRGRGGGQPERLGKKYAWIAFHEALARISDNFRMRRDGGWAEHAPEIFDGAWRTRVRDIDVTVGVTEVLEDWHGLGWWTPLQVVGWRDPLDNQRWVEDTANLPNFSALLRPVDPTGQEWTVLGGPGVICEEDVPWNSIRDHYEPRRYDFRLVSFLLPTDFVPNEWSDDLLAEFNNQLKIPSSVDRTFLGEMFWSPAFRHINNPYYERYPLKHAEEFFGLPLIMTCDYYFTDQEYDCSFRGSSLKMVLPSDFLVSQLNLTQPEMDGKWNHCSGDLVAWDPSVFAKGPGTCCVRDDYFRGLLGDHDLVIVWLLSGAKGVVIGRDSEWPGRLNFDFLYCWNGNDQPKEIYRRLRFEPPRPMDDLPLSPGMP